MYYWAAAISMIFLLIYVLVDEVFKSYQFIWFHESGVLILLGILASYINFTFLGDSLHFQEDTFFALILPPIILAAAYNMKKRRFFRNLAYILAYGIICTILTFIVCGLLIYWYPGVDVKLTLIDSMILGAVFSASDTVAAIATINPHEYPDLYSILFGEGVINDALAIILFDLIAFSGTEHLGLETVGVMSYKFVYKVVLSILFGLFFGIVTCYMMKGLTSTILTNSIIQVAILLDMSLISYLIVCALNLSGILSILITGIILAQYCFFNLSEEAQIGSTMVVQLVGHMCESFIFIYLGLVSFTYVYEQWNTIFVLYCTVCPLIGRGIGLLVTTLILKIFIRKKFAVSAKHLGVIWFAGAIRGGIAFALIMTLNSDYPTRNILVCYTLGTVLCSTIVYEILIPLWCKLMGIIIILEEGDEFNVLHPNYEHEPMSSKYYLKWKLHSWWTKFEAKYIWPNLIRADKVDMLHQYKEQRTNLAEIMDTSHEGSEEDEMDEIETSKTFKRPNTDKM